MDGWMDGTGRLEGRFELDMDGELSISGTMGMPTAPVVVIH